MKSASAYSNPWNPVNNTARTIVRAVPIIVALRSPWINLWCLYVTVAPLESSNTVLSNGTVIGLRAVTPTGGHCAIIKCYHLKVSLVYTNGQTISLKV